MGTDTTDGECNAVTAPYVLIAADRKDYASITHNVVLANLHLASTRNRNAADRDVFVNEKNL